MIILTSGPRDFKDETFIHNMMDLINLKYINPVSNPVFINGRARGCDTFVAEWCSKNDYEYHAFKPQYRFSGDKEAPLLRNKEMAEKANFGIIFDISFVK